MMDQAPTILADWLTDLDSQAICKLLTESGHQALFVGGCVRNALLGAPVSDLDISTDATPTQVMELAAAAGLRAVPTGIDHGTITVIVNGTAFEVTTFRKDVATDGRRAVVAFAQSIDDDAHRRDFTMNALYAQADGRVIDPLGGLPDLYARQIRFIDDPHQRIREDYLRILRFFRFHAWYGDVNGGIDAEGLAACAEHGDGLETLSRERVGQEMLKFLAAPDPAPALAAMSACGALWRILPGAGAHVLPVLIHVEEVAQLRPDPLRRLAAIGGDDHAERLRLSREQAARLDLLHAGMEGAAPPAELGYRHGADLAIDVLALRAALGGRECDPAEIEIARRAATQVFPIKAADLMPDLSGPALGRALRAAEDRWIASEFQLSRTDLLD